MKKRILSLLAAMMLLTALFAGCTANNPGGAGSPDPAPDGKAESEALVASIVEEAQSSIGSMTATFGDMFDIAITAQGETIVYTFKFGMTLEEEMLDTMKTSLADSMAGQEATFTDIVDVMREAGVENPAVVVEYLNGDGVEIYSTTF